MKVTAPPRSDQLNGDDFSGGRSATVTIAGVKEGSTDLALYDINLVEVEKRVWRPPLTVLRLLMAMWGDEATEWVGRKVTLYRDDTVRVGKEVMGGIRISHGSHLPSGDKPFTTRITTTRGRKAPFTVQPLAADAPTTTPAQTHTEPTAAEIASRASKAVEWFAATHNITQANLEAHVGKPIVEWSLADIDALKANPGAVVGSES